MKNNPPVSVFFVPVSNPKFDSDSMESESNIRHFYEAVKVINSVDIDMQGLYTKNQVKELIQSGVHVEIGKIGYFRI